MQGVRCRVHGVGRRVKGLYLSGKRLKGLSVLVLAVGFGHPRVDLSDESFKGWGLGFEI